MRVADIIKEKGDRVLSVPPETTISQIAHELKRENIGALMIAGDNGQLLGVVSERDIVRGIVELGTEVLDKPASDLMNHPVVTCTPLTRTEELMKRMLDDRIRHMPVVNKDTLLGVVSIGDVVKSVVKEFGLLRDVFEKEVVKSEDWPQDAD